MIDRDDVEREYAQAKSTTKAWAIAKPWVAMACSFAAGFLVHMVMFS